MLLTLSATPDNTRGPRFIEQAFASIHQANRARVPIVLGYGPCGPHVGLFVRLRRSLSSLVRSQLAAAYPDCKIETLPEESLAISDGTHTWCAELRLTPDLFPIRRHPEFEDSLLRRSADPLSGILSTLAKRSTSAGAPFVELHVRPIHRLRRLRYERVLKRLARPFYRRRPLLSSLYAMLATHRYLWPASLPFGWLSPRGHDRESQNDTVSRSHEREDTLQAAHAKLGRHLFSVRLRIIVRGEPGNDTRARRTIHELSGSFGQFTSPRLSMFKLSRIRRLRHKPRRYLSGGFLLSDEELATLFHPATDSVRTERMETNTWRQAEPPPIMPSGKGKGEAVLGRVRYRSRRETFGVRLDDRRRHLAIVGKTGMGKSTLLLNLVASDIAAGHGVGLIDPHGDLVEAVLARVTSRRTNDVVLIDAGDTGYPIAFNPLACSDLAMRPLVASGVLSAFKKLYGDSWGPRMEHILRNALLTLIAVPGSSLVSLLKLLSDKRYRRSVLSSVDDPVVRSFWFDEFNSWSERYRTEALAPIQNKVGHFLSSPILRAITGQVRGTIDLRRIIDGGQVLLVNLSKGRTGEDASTLLGALLVTSLQQAAMARADVPEEERRDFFLYVDEFQNFATQSFAMILSEARKYRLSLTIANQYLAQLDEETADAIFGNVGSLVSFQVGPSDAEILAEQFGGDLTATDLVALPQFTAYVRLLLDGMPTRPFSMETLPPQCRTPDAQRADKIRRHCRHRYGRPATVVEAEIGAVLAG